MFETHLRRCDQDAERFRVDSLLVHKLTVTTRADDEPTHIVQTLPIGLPVDRCGSQTHALKSPCLCRQFTSTVSYSSWMILIWSRSSSLSGDIMMTIFVLALSNSSGMTKGMEGLKVVDDQAKAPANGAGVEHE